MLDTYNILNSEIKQKKRFFAPYLSKETKIL